LEPTVAIGLAAAVGQTSLKSDRLGRKAAGNSIGIRVWMGIAECPWAFGHLVYSVNPCCLGRSAFMPGWLGAPRVQWYATDLERHASVRCHSLQNASDPFGNPNGFAVAIGGAVLLREAGRQDHRGSI